MSKNDFWKKTKNEKRLMWDWEFLTGLSDEKRVYSLSDRDIAALLGIGPQMSWKTRWENYGSFDLVQAFRDTLLYRLMTPSDCAECEDGDCVTYPANHPSISYFPPLSHPLWIVTPSGGVYYDAASIGDSGWDFTVDGIPSVDFSFAGEAEVELEFIKIPLGGIAAFFPDGNGFLAEIVDLKSYDLSQDDLLDFILSGFNIVETEIQEINFTTSGPHNITSRFYPQINLDGIPIGIGGGLERITICGDAARTAQPMTLIRWNNCQLEQSLDNGATWTALGAAVRDYSAACNFFVRSNGVDFEGINSRFTRHFAETIIATDPVGGTNLNLNGPARELFWIRQGQYLARMRYIPSGVFPDTHGSELRFDLHDYAGVDSILRLARSNDEARIGFLGASPVTKQVLPAGTEFDVGGLLLANALENLGLIEAPGANLKPQDDSFNFTDALFECDVDPRNSRFDIIWNSLVDATDGVFAQLGVCLSEFIEYQVNQRLQELGLFAPYALDFTDGDAFANVTEGTLTGGGYQSGPNGSSDQEVAAGVAGSSANPSWSLGGIAANVSSIELVFRNNGASQASIEVQMEGYLNGVKTMDLDLPGFVVNAGETATQSIDPSGTPDIDTIGFVEFRDRIGNNPFLLERIEVLTS